MSEAVEAVEATETTTTRPKKKRRQVWNDKRRLSLLKALMDGPKDLTELFEKFRSVEKYRGLTYERVVREAKAMCAEAVSGEGDFYVLDLPPARPKERPKRVTVADKRRALIEEHAKKMNARARNKILKERAEAAAEGNEENA